MIKKTVFIIYIIFFIPLLLGMAKAPKPLETIQTVGQEKEWFIHHFTAHILECQKIDEETIFLKSDGMILSKDGQATFQIQIGDEFGTPDHHSMKNYTLKRIENNGVIIGYESTFNHVSFGKNLITVDSGEIFIQFTSE